jgi:hypothetical protein
MGVGPETIVEFYLFEYRLKFSCTSFAILFLHKMFLPYILSIGCATSTLDGSSSRGYDGVLAADYSLKTEFLQIVELAFPSLLTFYDVTTNNIFFYCLLYLPPGWAARLLFHRFYVNGPHLCCTLAQGLTL